ncbi:MAG: putative membrane protein [Lentimonas sp.]|jgi:putative membrane protein
MNFKQILRSLIAVILAVIIASNTASGIHFDSAEALIVAAILLGLFNIFLKPLLMLFSLPFIVLTFGLGIWIINALLFLLTSAMVNGFYVDSFVSALWGALLISIVNLIATIYFGDFKNSGVTVKFNRSVRVPNTDAPTNRGNISRQPKASIQEDDVIDI